MSERKQGRGDDGETQVLEWKGPGPLPPIPNINYALYMLDLMKPYGDTLAVADAETGRGRTYREICDLVPRVAGGLVAGGVKPGDHVLLLLPTHMDYPLLMLSIIYCGAVCVPVNPTLTQDELIHALKVSEAKWALVHEASTDILEGARDKLPEGGVRGVWVVEADSTRPRPQPTPSLATLASHHPVPPVTKVEWALHVSRWVGMMLFSSGTTGLPKGVLIPHQALLLGIINRLYMEKLRVESGQGGARAQDINRSQLLVLPVAHLFGHGMTIAALVWGGTVYFLAKFSPRAYFHAIDKYKVTLSALVPHLVKFLSETPLWNQYDTSSLMVFCSGGDILPPAIPTRFKKKTRHSVVSRYGMTEVFSAVTSHTLESQLQHPTSVGYILPYMKIKGGGCGERCDTGRGTEGEICVKSPSNMLGYANDPAATAATIDSEGWLHTGDVGYYDSQGLLYVTGRIKDIIKVKGHQVAPAELENILKQHPDVEDAAVIGVPHQRTNEVPRAYVVPRPGVNINPQTLQEFVADRTVEFKRLTGGVVVVAAIPRNATGKVLRKKLLTDHTTPAARL